MAYIQLSTLGKGGRFLNETKNLNFYLTLHSSRERWVLVAAQHQVSAVSSQSGRCCCIGGNLACAPSFLYSSVKHRASYQIPNYVRPLPTADPWDESSPPLWCLHNGSIDGLLLSRLKASSSQDRLAMLARKRWAHHSSRSMGTKSAQKWEQRIKV